MNREVHVRICEGLGGKFPRSTRRLLPRHLTRTQHIISIPSLADGLSRFKVVLIGDNESLGRDSLYRPRTKLRFLCVMVRVLQMGI